MLLPMVSEEARTSLSAAGWAGSPVRRLCPLARRENQHTAPSRTTCRLLVAADPRYSARPCNTTLRRATWTVWDCFYKRYFAHLHSVPHDSNVSSFYPFIQESYLFSKMFMQLFTYTYTCDVSFIFFFVNSH